MSLLIRMRRTGQVDYKTLVEQLEQARLANSTLEAEGAAGQSKADQPQVPC